MRGIAVHTAARILAAAQPGEVLVSGTVRDLLAGSGLQCDDRGEIDLRGIEGAGTCGVGASLSAPGDIALAT